MIIAPYGTQHYWTLARFPGGSARSHAAAVLVTRRATIARPSASGCLPAFRATSAPTCWRPAVFPRSTRPSMSPRPRGSTTSTGGIAPSCRRPEPGQASVARGRWDRLPQRNLRSTDPARRRTRACSPGRPSLLALLGVASGPRELAIRMWGGGALPTLPDPPLRRGLRRLLRGLHVVGRVLPRPDGNPKAQFGFGWDFSPRVLSTGIWDDIRLVRTGRGATSPTSMPCREPARRQPRPDARALASRLQRASLSGPAAARAAVVTLSQPGRASPSRSRRAVYPGGSAEPTLTFRVSRRCARWWPWDQGRAGRRTAVPADRPAAGRGAASSTKWTRPWASARWAASAFDRATLALHGERPPVFLRGANWVPADILPGRVAPEDYARLVGHGRATRASTSCGCGAAGVREKRAFWDECDRRGIMACRSSRSPARSSTTIRATRATSSVA